jgi:hypothetical protein
MKRASDSVCIVTGQQADHLHHLTLRRDVDGPYLDVDLTAPLTRREHTLYHQALRIAGLGEQTKVSEHDLRALRLSHFLGWLVMGHEDEDEVIGAWLGSSQRHILGALITTAPSPRPAADEMVKAGKR